MKSVSIIFFIAGLICLLGFIKYLIDFKRPGVYPPKQVIKKRATAFAGGGGVCLIIALIFSLF